MTSWLPTAWSKLLLSVMQYTFCVSLFYRLFQYTTKNLDSPVILPYPKAHGNCAVFLKKQTYCVAGTYIDNFMTDRKDKFLKI